MTVELAPFDPEWLEVEKAMGGRMALPAEPVNDSRARFDGIFAQVAPLLPPKGDDTDETDVTNPKSGRRVRIYRPANAKGILPVGLYIHSGGWYGGSIENEDSLARNVCVNSNIILYSPDYRLAPEHPYPAGLDDVCAAYEFMYETAASHGGDPKKKFVMGGSAGGNLTCAVGLKYATNPELRASGLCIFVAATCEPSLLPEEYKARYTPEKYTDAPLVGLEILHQAREWLAAPPADPLYSPLLHPDLKHLPPSYIATCSKDPMHLEGLFFAEEAKKLGAKVDYVEWVGMPHFFWILPMMKKTQDFMYMWNSKLKGLIAAA